MSLAQNVQTLRLVAHETKQDLSDATGVPVATIARVEKSSIRTNPSVLRSLAEHYHLSVARLNS
ncbi:MAG: XRE family transcriptional regulator [Oxalobacteraceae bacterium]|nr:MAG: XRE family transcriptional regulator [Oxalobacteraceae bacterium]